MDDDKTSMNQGKWGKFKVMFVATLLCSLFSLLCSMLSWALEAHSDLLINVYFKVSLVQFIYFIFVV